MFHSNLAGMCRAGVPLPRALRLSSHDLNRSPLGQAALRMAAEVEQGTNLAEAYARQRPSLPPLYQAMVEVGLASGDLPAVLDDVALHAAERARIAHRLRSVTFYPLLSALLVLAIGVALAVSFEPLRQLGDSLPGMAMSRHGKWASWIALVLLGAGVLGVVGFAWMRNPLDGGVALRGLRFGLPLIGELRACAAKAGFAGTMGMLLARQMPLQRALTLAAAATDDQRVAQQVEVMRSRAESGESLVESLRAGDLISPVMLCFVEAGESGGGAARALADVSAIYRNRLERGVDHLCALAAPVGLAAAGVVVLLFALFYLGPWVDGYRALMGS
ncbi:MAG: type II secretion system F family protein [Planctomycetes bacterium]|nr:type II secretion system F family protein [Planctomycetota bacterium]